MSAPLPPVIVDPPPGVPCPAGYWPLYVACEGDPDPGVLTLFVPGELLDHVDALFPEVEFDPATLERARGEWRAESGR